MANSKLKIKKLDRRHNGYGLMKYFVEPAYGADYVENFYELKNWCIDQWGITRPLADWREGSKLMEVPGDVNPAWTYLRDEYRTRILFRDKEEAALFTLRWGGV